MNDAQAMHAKAMALKNLDYIENMKYQMEAIVRICEGPYVEDTLPMRIVEYFGTMNRIIHQVERVEADMMPRFAKMQAFPKRIK